MIDITGLWNDQHPHLAPYPSHLALADGELRACPVCGCEGALTLLADLKTGAGDWLRSTKVVHCPACSRYAVADEGLPRGRVIAVDARLWAAEPRFANIEPTTRCNFGCWYCIGRHMEQADIDPAAFDRMLGHAEGIDTVALVGEGEPLLHPAIFEMADRARRTGRRVVMISNGSQFSAANIERLCRTEIAYIAVSIDSVQPELFSRSRRHGDLAQILQGMRRLRQFRDRHGYRYPRIGIKGTLLDFNRTEMLDVVRLARDHGAEIFESFQPLNPKCSYAAIYPEGQRHQLDRVPEISRIIAEQNAEARTLLRPCENFMAEEGIVLGAAGRPNSLRPNCDQPHVYALLSGDVTPCCQVKSAASRSWNLAQRPLREILHDPEYENLRFNLWNGIFPEYCAGCTAAGGAFA